MRFVPGVSSNLAQPLEDARGGIELVVRHDRGGAVHGDFGIMGPTPGMVRYERFLEDQGVGFAVLIVCPIWWDFGSRAVKNAMEVK